MRAFAHRTRSITGEVARLAFPAAASVHLRCGRCGYERLPPCPAGPAAGRQARTPHDGPGTACAARLRVAARRPATARGSRPAALPAQPRDPAVARSARAVR
ncbi:hypothetical protein G6F59_016961 [Rhizopus arrhizus]|nr:hypothetical protein G6F59_016961 [Rhizopus arrhizus]